MRSFCSPCVLCDLQLAAFCLNLRQFCFHAAGISTRLSSASKYNTMTDHVDYSDFAPRFGRAGTGNLNEWGDNDNFDVDVLAEFLLGDEKTSNVTFDFK